MKCKEHNQDAIAVCANCGVALCNDCFQKSNSGKYCCSEACKNEICLSEEASILTIEHITKVAKINAYFSYLFGVLLLGFAVAGIIKGWILVFVYFILFGLGVCVLGYYYQKSSIFKIPVNQAAQTGQQGHSVSEHSGEIE